MAVTGYGYTLVYLYACLTDNISHKQQGCPHGQPFLHACYAIV